jgi:dynein heavy chain
LNNKVLENPEKQAQLVINFSSRTSSLDVQRTIEDHIEKRVGDTYGPISQKNLNVFIDDMNMPNVDIYGTQQPIALLKLLIERGGFYERGQKSLNWMNIKDLHFIAAMGLPGGGRNEVDPRFLSQFCIFNISFPSSDSLMTIYSSILNAHLRNFDPKVIQVGEKLTEITLNLYQSVTKKLPPTPSKFHYIFNLRDLSRVYEGLCLSTIDKFNVPHALVRLWRNECMRVFHDRLINEEDKDFVSCEVDGLIKENFPNEANEALINPMVFGDFGLANKETDRNLRLYEDLIDYQNVKGILEVV